MIAISPLKSIIHVDNQISEMLSLSCTPMERKFVLRKSTSTFSITRCLRITHYIEQCQRLWSTNRTRQKKDAQHNSEYFVQLKFKLQRKSEDCPICKNSTSCKQHLKAGRQTTGPASKHRWKLFFLIVFLLILPASYTQNLNCSGS